MQLQGKLISPSCYRQSQGIVWILLLLIFPLGAQSQVSGSSSGIFDNPVLQSDTSVVTGVGTSSFTWGVGIDGPPSSLSYSGEAFSTELDVYFSLGTLNYYNGTISSNTGASAVDLNINVAISMPSGVMEEFVETLTLVNTPNVGTPEEQADRVFLPTTIPEITFEADGIPYTLEFLGFGNITGGGSANTLDEFFVFEGEMASAELLGRVSVCGEAGFQFTNESVPPWPDKKLCYKFNMSQVSGSGNFSIILTLRNPHPEDIDLGVCMMANSEGEEDLRPEWIAANSNGTWDCTETGNNYPQPWPPSFHFGCRSFSVPSGGEVYWADTGVLPPFAPRLSPYVDFLRDLPISLACETGIRGENQFLVPDAPAEDYVNVWALMAPLQRLDPVVASKLASSNQDTFQLSSSIEWPTGNWFTMGNPDTYFALLNGTIIDAPTGTIVTFHFPEGSPETEVTYEIPPAYPGNPTCLGEEFDISVPFVMPPGHGSIEMEVFVPEECAALREGTRVRFLAEAVSDVGSPGFEPGEFIVGYAGTCVVDSTPPMVVSSSLTQLPGGMIDVKVAATDAITAPLRALVDIQVDGQFVEQLTMGFDEFAVSGDTVFFRESIGPYPAGSQVEVTPEVYDDVANIAPVAPSMIDIVLPEEFALLQNFPNPFNLSTTIRYDIPEKSYVTLKVYDVLGRELAVLVDGEIEAGNHSLEWTPERTATSIYFYRFQAGSYSETRKLVLLK